MFIRKNVVLLAVLLILLPSILHGKDYRCVISYHPPPFHYSQWTIEVYRDKKQYFIASANIPGLKQKAGIDRENYLSFIKKMNKMGIWRLQDYYHSDSSNAYFLVSASDKNYSNTFRIEENVTYPGLKANYIEIIRTFKNYARIFLEK